MLVSCYVISARMSQHRSLLSPPLKLLEILHPKNCVALVVIVEFVVAEPPRWVAQLLVVV